MGIKLRAKASMECYACNSVYVRITPSPHQKLTDLAAERAEVEHPVEVSERAGNFGRLHRRAASLDRLDRRFQS